MAEKRTLSRRFDEWRPSKGALVWTAVGTAAVVLVVGFTWGGWVTGGTAEAMARKSASDAQAELAAAVCVHQFTQAEDARNQLVSLKDLSSYRRSRFVEEGGWATLPGSERPLRNVGGLCAQRLLELQLPEVAADNSDQNAPVAH
ncbi:MAG: hypothetical protein R3349_02605 [Geminicoccaceae bacterium]|nr:hypothetical protein [Geminicoccaceae bacterium]